MGEFHDIAIIVLDSCPEDKNAADMWTQLALLSDWGRDPLKGGRCAVPVAELAARARVSYPTAKKGLALLEDTGLIHAERVMSGRRILQTRYVLLPRAEGSRA